MGKSRAVTPTTHGSPFRGLSIAQRVGDSAVFSWYIWVHVCGTNTWCCCFSSWESGHVPWWGFTVCPTFGCRFKYAHFIATDPQRDVLVDCRKIFSASSSILFLCTVLWRKHSLGDEYGFSLLVFLILWFIFWFFVISLCLFAFVYGKSR
jgi:hypothetical protein